MVCFLTSRMDLPDTEQLNPANHFVERLRKHLPRPCRVLDLCSDPEGWEITDYYGALTKQSLENADIPVEQFADDFQILQIDKPIEIQRPPELSDIDGEFLQILKILDSFQRLHRS